MGTLVVVRRSRIVQCALSDARNTVIATRASDDVRSLQLLNSEYMDRTRSLILACVNVSARISVRCSAIEKMGRFGTVRK